MFRTMFGVLGVCLLASSAASGEPAVPANHQDVPTLPASFQKFAGLAGTKFSAADGSALALTLTDRGLTREISVPDGRIKKTLFAPLNDRLGTVSEGSGALNLAGIFRFTETGIAAAYDNGRSEALTLNPSGGVSMVMSLPTGEVDCRTWYPAGHHFSLAERKAALAEYAKQLGIAAPHSDGSVNPACTMAAEKAADAKLGSSHAASRMVSNARPGTGIFGRLIARLLLSYAHQHGPADLAAAGPSNPQSSDGFEDFYVNFLAAHEGGYTENDGNGSPANFGINQGANPDVDVLNLTQAEAKQILHDRYWVASGADRLPAALAAVHGDTAINMGVGTANELLAQSGGDREKYLALRDARYRAIAAPELGKARYLPVWLGRNEDLRNYAGSDDNFDGQQSGAAVPAFQDTFDPRDGYRQMR